jgi:solute carrier family 41
LKSISLNPDNFATPMAASIGDIVSLSILAFITSILYKNKGETVVFAQTLDKKLSSRFLYLGDIRCDKLLRGGFAFVDTSRVTKSVHTTCAEKWLDSSSFSTCYQRVKFRKVSFYLCLPEADLLFFLRRLSGLLLGRAVTEFSGFVVFQPIINGVGGNLVSVQACKISTLLNQATLPGIIPSFTRIFELPWLTLFKGTPYANSARILILMSIPGQVMFVYIADFLHTWSVTIGAPFVFSYLFVSLMQVSTLSWQKIL